MGALRQIWERFEEGFIVFLLSTMTLVTFFYVVFNNLYGVFFAIGDSFAEGSVMANIGYAIGDFFLDAVQTMTWSNALTKALFGWMIFAGIAYGVRIGGHIGVDALVKLAKPGTQKVIGIIGCLLCLGYAGLLTVGSFSWVSTLQSVNIGADDLGQYGIKQWHIASIVPVGFALVFIRFLEIFVRILRNQQTGLGLADEAADAATLGTKEGDK